MTSQQLHLPLQSHPRSLGLSCGDASWLPLLPHLPCCTPFPDKGQILFFPYLGLQEVPITFRIKAKLFTKAHPPPSSPSSLCFAHLVPEMLCFLLPQGRDTCYVLHLKTFPQDLHTGCCHQKSQRNHPWRFFLWPCSLTSQHLLLCETLIVYLLLHQNKTSIGWNQVYLVHYCIFSVHTVGTQ